MRFLSKTKTEYDLGDFAVDKSISLFKRVFFITSCDQFTRSFYANRLGIDLAPNVSPVPVHDSQPQRDEPLQSLVPKVPRKTSEQIRREIDFAGVKVRTCCALQTHGYVLVSDPPPPPPTAAFPCGV
jgi:hypothetical protein